MTFRTFVVCLLAAGPASAASAEPSSTRIIEIIGEKTPEERTTDVAGPLRVQRSEPCGSNADGWFCGAVSRGPTSASLVYSSPALKVNAPKGATVVVTWTGTVTCETRTAPTTKRGDPALVDFVVDLALLDDKPDAAEPAGEGRARLGRRFRANLDGAAPDATVSIDRYPVTLTRSFVRKRSGVQDHYLHVEAAFVAGQGVCSVSGGAMTAILADR